MRWLLHRPSHKLTQTVWCQRRARIHAIWPPSCVKSGHPSSPTTRSLTDEASVLKDGSYGILKHGARSVLPIRQTRLATFKQLEYESRFDAYPLEGWRLVDRAENRHNLDLWLELLLYRRRVYGVKGMLPVWLGLVRRDVLLAYHPPVSTIWSMLLELGYFDHHILHQLYRYAEYTYIRTGYKYPNLYVNIIHHWIVRKDTALTNVWHKRLRTMFPPTPNQYCDLFASIDQPMTSSKFASFFQNAYEELSIQGVYASIVPALCTAQLFKAAWEWHDFFVEHKDLPSSSLATNQLLDYLSMTENSERASKVTKDLLDAGVPFVRETCPKPDEREMLTKEAMNLIHGEHYKIAPKELSDDFCARLFATRFFSVESMVKGLEILGTQAIGPKALRELMSRTLSGGKKDQYLAQEILQQLSTAGISIGRSTFARVVKELATDHKTNTLYDLVACDMHVEAFEDRRLQESLLHQYYQAEDEKGIQRSLAILLVDTRDDQQRQCRSWNYWLRSAINYRDWKEISRILGSMVELEIEVIPRSYSYMVQRLLCARHAGQQPATPTNDLDPLINTWQSVMRKGGSVPLRLWAEVLTRLGTNGFLHEYEKLALWLAMWFARPPFRASQMSSRASAKFVKDSPRFAELLAVGRMVRTQDAPNPLRQLFPAAAIQGIMAWGFHNERPEFYSDVDARSSTSARWTWGLRLLCRLQALGLQFSPTTIGKACEIRLIQIFGKGVSRQLKNRGSQTHHSSGRIEQYLSSMEHIMGEDLFKGLYAHTFDFDRILRLRTIGQLIRWKAARLARYPPLSPGRRLPSSAKYHRWRQSACVKRRTTSEIT